MLNAALDRMDELVTSLINGVGGLTAVFGRFTGIGAAMKLGKIVSGSM